MFGNASKPRISKMFRKHKKTVSKQTGNYVFATSTFAILVKFAFEFRHKPWTLHRESRIYFHKNLTFAKMTRYHRFVSGELASNNNEYTLEKLMMF